MTVSYSDKILTSNRLGAFSQLLFIWKGSVYKLVWADLVLYLTFYFSISSIYRFVLDEEQKRLFERASMFCERHTSLIPLTFVLAFYVSHVVSRWWAQWNAIPWPDALAFKINSYCSGQDDETRLIRRTVTRYACLAIIETLRMVSSPVKKRFPTYGHLKEAGVMTEDEKRAIQNAQTKSEYLNYVYWMPLAWASSLTVDAYQKGFIAKARYVSDVNEELNKLRILCGTIISYDWVSLPLVYTQVVALAVYSFFGVTLLGRQWLDPEAQIEGYTNHHIDYIVPIFTCLQFVFYVGWLKVAEALLNPYGEDDEDFDTNWMVDRHLQLSYMMVDLVGQHPPRLEKDMHWHISIPEELPYTVASLPFRVQPAQTSAELLSVPLTKQQPIYPQYLGTKDNRGTPPEGGTAWLLNSAIAKIMTPIVRRRKPSEAMSSKSLPYAQKSYQLHQRRKTTVSLSPYMGRRMMSSSSVDSIPSVISTEPGSRKVSTSSRPTLPLVKEEQLHSISIVVPQIFCTSPTNMAEDDNKAQPKIDVEDKY